MRRAAETALQSAVANRGSGRAKPSSQASYAAHQDLWQGHGENKFIRQS
jgi:hypothetical protein